MEKELIIPLREKLISFETAILAKEKGFKNACDGFVNKDNEYIFMPDLLYPNNSEFSHNSEEDPEVVEWKELMKTLVLAPTQSLLQKWLREVHNCFIDILPHRDGDSKNKQWKSKKDVFWTVEVDYYGKNFEIELTDDSDFTQHFNNSYEEALEIGLYQALLLL